MYNIRKLNQNQNIQKILFEQIALFECIIFAKTSRFANLTYTFIDDLTIYEKKTSRIRNKPEP